MMKQDMHIRRVETKEDYRAALARINTLMSALPDSPEGKELDMLATLVDAYEAKHYPIQTPIQMKEPSC